MTNNTPASEVPWTPFKWTDEDDCRPANVGDWYVAEADAQGRPAGDICYLATHKIDGIDQTEAKARLIAESPAMAALLEAIDKSWTEYWPEGPDFDGHAVKIADETAVIWRGIRESLSRIRSVK